MPAGLGNFKDDIRLKDFICYECQRRFSVLETVFLQNGIEAFFRRILGVRGRKRNASKNIFVEPTLGLPPLTIKGLHPTLQKELLWEMVGEKEAFLMHQLVFEKEDGSLIQIPIRSGRVAEDLSRFENEWGTWRLLACIAGEGDEPELRDTIGADLLLMKEEPPDNTEGVELEGEVRAQISLPYVQAICKIAFHFVLARFHFTGFEPEFDDLKRFIYTGVGQNPAKIVEHP